MPPYLVTRGSSQGLGNLFSSSMTTPNQSLISYAPTSRQCSGNPFTSERLAEHAKHLLRAGGELLPTLCTDYLGTGSTRVGLEDLSKLGRLQGSMRRAGISTKQRDVIINDNTYRFILTNSAHWEA